MALQKAWGDDHPDTQAALAALLGARSKRDAARPPRSQEPKQTRLTLEAKESELAQAVADLGALVLRRDQLLVEISEAEERVLVKQG